MLYNTFNNKYYDCSICDVSFALLDKLSIIDKHEYIVANTMSGKILHCTSNTYIFSKFSHKDIIERGINYFIELMHEKDAKEISLTIRAFKELTHSIGDEAKYLIYHTTINLRFGKQYRPFLIKAFALSNDHALITLKPAPHNTTDHQLCWNHKTKTLYKYSKEAHRFNKAERKLLYDKQMEILLLLGTGMNKKEVAATLCITTNTLNYHLKEIKAKLGTSSISESISIITSYNFLI